MSIFLQVWGIKQWLSLGNKIGRLAKVGLGNLLLFCFIPISSLHPYYIFIQAHVYEMDFCED